ncbi:MAG: hypothetical protein KKB62_01430, partial [Nanoarchaeota archaeon]|nr:hypothetical protein [Nanoarchaeota archaeon]
GRIRNLRDYVVPKKIIVCKVLRVQNNNIELSLRRVSQKEQKEVLERHKLEKSYTSVLKSVLDEKVDEAIKKIKEGENLIDFLENSKNDQARLKKIVGKTNAEKIVEILKKQKKKKVEIKKEIKIHSSKPNGLTLIKNILGNTKKIKVMYVAAGRYFLISEGETMKKADSLLKEVIEQIEKEAKKEKIEFAAVN